MPKRNIDLPRLLVVATGSKQYDVNGGGSGFQNLVIKSSAYSYCVSAVASNIENGSVRARAEKLGIPFIYRPTPWSPEVCEELEAGSNHTMLSGFMNYWNGTPSRTSNIHPGILPEYGGKGMYGHHVHEKVLSDYHEGLISCTGVSIHFVRRQVDGFKYDDGPVIFRQCVELYPHDDAETIARRVNAAEHQYQPMVAGLLANRQITWDGNDPDSVIYPESYKGNVFFTHRTK